MNVFKNWYYSITIRFYQFQYFIAACLCLAAIYQEIFQSNNGNDLMILFNWDWSRLINKLYLIRSLNLLVSEASISKWSKSIEQLHSSRWSGTADCLTLLRCFPVKLDIPICSAALVKRVVVCFTIMNNLQVTTRLSVNNVRVDLFLLGIIITVQRIQFVWWLENNFNFTEL